MQYLGGKARVVRYIAPVLLNARRAGHSIYLEPFLGGASVFEQVAPSFPTAIGSDVHPDLMLLWAAARDGWEPPEVVTRADYDSLRGMLTSSELRGFVGFGCSFGGKWFGGYASNARGDDFAGAARRGVLRKAEAMRRVKDLYLLCQSYDRHSPGDGWVVYCDPPYAGTTGYAGTKPWDADAFWRTAEKWAADGAAVFVSEYAAPSGWDVVWEAPAKVSLRRDANDVPAVERLFTFGGTR